MTTSLDRASARAAAADALRQRLETRSASCAVIGLGFIGATVAGALARAGFAVAGIDRDAAVVEGLSERSDGGFPASVDAGALMTSDVVVVAVRVAPSPAGEVDLRSLEAVGALLGELPPRPRLVVVTTTVPPGTTRAFAERLGTREHRFVVHAPERLQVDDPVWTIDRIPHVVGGVDALSTELGCILLRHLTDSVVPVASPEAAELAKLLENSSNAVGIALVAEITRLAHAFGIEMSEVTAAAATKPFGYRAFHPGPGIGGHCIPNDLRMLRATARAAGVPARVLDAAVAVSSEMPADTVDRLECALATRGLELAGADVVLVGLGFKVGTADTAATPAAAVARELRRRGAHPFAVDSRVPRLDVDGEPLPWVDHRSLGNGRRFAAAIVLAGDSAVAAGALASSAQVVLDAGGGRNLAGTLPRADRL